MNSETPRKPIVLAVLLVMVGVTLLVVLTIARRQPPAEIPIAKSVRASTEFHFKSPPPKVSASSNPDETRPKVPADPFAALRLPREQAEAWLAKHHRDAASLLAVFRAQNDTNYLNEAATNFPNDPRVQLAVLTADVFPADRRKWLDAFKQSSPSNSLADCLSAVNYFKEGKTEAALQDLLAANGKPQFVGHIIENQLDAEELYADAGKTAGESAKLGHMNMWSEYGKELPAIKQAAIGIRDVIKAKAEASDTGNNVQLVQLGLGLADKLKSGGTEKLFFSQRVGMATEAIMLNQLDQNTGYDFLDGQTPAQRLATLKQQRTEWNQLGANWETAFSQMTDAEQASFYRRTKISGDQAALKWLVELHPPTTAQP